MRYPCAEIFPQGRRAGRTSDGSKRKPFPPGCGDQRRMTTDWPICRRSGGIPEKEVRNRYSTGLPGPGPIGAGRAAISTAKTTPAHSMMNSASCWRRRNARPTPRNGSTPACTGLMALMAPARATIMWISKPVSWSSQNRRTSIRSRMPASSSRSRTISSMTAASWTCGCARHACSNTGLAQAPIFPA